MQPKEVKDFERWGVPPPSHAPHGTDDEIRSQMKRVLPHSWRLEGNMLIGKTEFGDVSQGIPTDYILTGTDASGMPILEKIDFDKKQSKVVH